MSRLRRRLLLAVVFLTALVTVLATSACGASDDSSSTGSSEGFPVSIEHGHGTTTIPTKPQRVVTMGWMTQDIVAALGTVPVGVDVSWGGDDDGFTPWFIHQVRDVLGKPMPTTLSDSEEPDYEEILQLKPDLILAPHSGLTENQYKRLSQIAPTIPYAERPWTSGNWKDLTRVVAKSLGEDSEAETLIAETQAQITAAADANPQIKGKSFIYGLSLPPGSTDLGVYISDDPRVAFLREFGLVDSPDLTKALGSIGDDAFYGAVSLEKLGTIKTDMFVGWSRNAQETKGTLADPKFSRWQPVSGGHYLFIESEQMGMATNGPTPLSIPWAIDKGFVRDLGSAANGTPVVVPAS